MPASLAKVSRLLYCRVLIALVESLRVTKRLPSAHQMRFCCKLTSCNRLLRLWEKEIVTALLAVLPVN